LKTKCTKFYSDLFVFAISILQCLGINFFTGHSVGLQHCWFATYLKYFRRRQTLKHLLWKTAALISPFYNAVYSFVTATNQNIAIVQN